VIPGGESAGVSGATVRRRLSVVSGFFAFSQARGDVAANPVPRGLPTRWERSRPRQGVPLVRATRRLPRILSPAEADALTAALRTHRDRAMVAAMVLGGLRRCEVLGLRLEDLHAAERRVFIAEGNGGRQRLIPVSGRFFAGGGCLPGCRTAAGHPLRPGLCGAQGAAPRAAAVDQGDR
jgi:integrase